MDIKNELSVREMITWCRDVTEKFQQQAERRWKHYEVEEHHLGEIEEFYHEWFNNKDKEKTILEFWDTIFSMLTMLAVDDLRHITDEEWYDGYLKTVAKINHRVETEHYKKGKGNYS